MRSKIVATAALFALATGLTAAAGRWLPSPFQGPVAAALVAALGALLVTMARSPEHADASFDADAARVEQSPVADTLTLPRLPHLPPSQPANQPGPGVG